MTSYKIRCHHHIEAEDGHYRINTLPYYDIKLTTRVATQFQIFLFTVLYDNVYNHLKSNGHCIYIYTHVIPLMDNMYVTILHGNNVLQNLKQFKDSHG